MLNVPCIFVVFCFCFVFVQEVNREKISENIDYLELWTTQVCLGQCVVASKEFQDLSM